MIPKDEFLARYNISEPEFAQSALDWDEAIRIHDDYYLHRVWLEDAATLLTRKLQAASGVHFVRVRTKDPEHLIAKIIRKRLEDKSRIIELANYREEITDLLAARVVHLFKDEWAEIHKYILVTWNPIEPPTANIRTGDSPEIVAKFQDKGCNIYEHPFGYRSIHYLIEFHPDKNRCIAEIQVRTIFEEGWAEIDHKVRYPYGIAGPIIAEFLTLFNRLAGAADEMGSFVQSLKLNDESGDKAVKKASEQKGELVSKLKESIGMLNIDQVSKEELLTKIESLSKISAKEILSEWVRLGADAALKKPSRDV